MDTLEKRSEPIRRIVVGVDGSEGATRAARWAARLALVTGAEVVVANAMGAPVFAASLSLVGGAIVNDDWQTAWKEWIEFVERTLDESWSLPLAEAGVAFRTQAVEGGPEALIELAGKIEADMIVVGRRGRGGFAELMLGSFSHYLVHHSRIPVVVVPEPGQD